MQALLQEVIPWYGLNHRNITPFIGYTFDNGYAALISEWQDHGHIFEYLSKHPRANRLEMVRSPTRGRRLSLYSRFPHAFLDRSDCGRDCLLARQEPLAYTW